MEANDPQGLPVIHIVGGGLAGSEAAWQALQAGARVVLHEMRPQKRTEAHKTGHLAELVCSNSLKSTNPASAPGELKEEMRGLGSLVVQAGEKAKVPAGQALAVDREVFSQEITQALENHPRFERVSEEVTRIPSSEELAARGECWIIATGPLTTQALAEALGDLSETGERLYFYDAIAPIVSADSIDYNECFFASRYGKGDEEEGDYLNIPLDRELYESFVDAIANAEYTSLHKFEETQYFESCLPVEVMISRGRETLRFGPMKPVGLPDPKTGENPWAAIQLRRENKDGTMYSLVGFQTKMKWPEQKRIFAMLPALRDAEFFRFGSVHRNTYLKSPELLAGDLSFKKSPRVFLAGQITGVEGYTESASMGLVAARAAVAKAQGREFPAPPPTTVIGSLLNYVTEGPLGDFQPMNANLGLLPALKKQRGEKKAQKKARQCERARAAFDAYLAHTSRKEGPRADT